MGIGHHGVRPTGDLLELLDRVLAQDRGPHVLEGKLAIGVQLGSAVQWWEVTFVTPPETAWVAQPSDHARVALLLTQTVAGEIIEQGMIAHPSGCFAFGDRALFLRFLTRYLRDAERHPPGASQLLKGLLAAFQTARALSSLPELRRAVARACVPEREVTPQFVLDLFSDEPLAVGRALDLLRAGLAFLDSLPASAGARGGEIGSQILELGRPRTLLMRALQRVNPRPGALVLTKDEARQLIAVVREDRRLLSVLRLGDLRVGGLCSVDPSANPEIWALLETVSVLRDVATHESCEASASDLLQTDPVREAFVELLVDARSRAPKKGQPRSADDRAWFERQRHRFEQVAAKRASA
ncbi:MAG: hypothetical protein IT384_14440 [Deltaproteobacteria bacterium]|nr:hypothetical protein [Deltaproteobacteria bacterium]